jgi:hypothetical protein
MVAAWVMFVAGCTIAALGVRALRGGGEDGPRPRAALRGGVGRILMGAGLAADGVPMMAGWSSGVGATVAGAGLVAVLLGVVLQLRTRG